MTQCLAYSNDGGKTLIKYDKNPVLPQVGGGNRDPKVIWHEATRRWVMVLYIEKNKKHIIQFHSSRDLLKWTYGSELESFYECPDLFELKDDQGKNVWVLTGADSSYLLGDFDGEIFHPLAPVLPGHPGNVFYAAQSFSDAPDGRRIQIGWLRAPSPKMEFNQCMSLPLELGLTRTTQGLRLTTLPAKEVAALEGGKFSIVQADKPTQLDPGKSVLQSITTENFKFDLTLAPGADTEIRLNLRGAKIFYDAAKQELKINDLTTPAPLINGKLKLTAYLDRTTLEIFSSEGLTYFPVAFLPAAGNRELGIDCLRGSTVIDSMSVTGMKSIWPGK